MFTKYDKLLAGLLPFVVWGLTQLGIPVGPEWAAAVTVVLTPLLVYAIPNKL